jgi:hypothetical protein
MPGANQFAHDRRAQVVEYYINYFQEADTVVKDDSVSFIELSKNV